MAGPKKTRVRPRTACSRCEGYLERKTVLDERPAHRHYGDLEGVMTVGTTTVLHFICVVCGNVGAYQATPHERVGNAPRPR